jgi:cell wall-associated NlpC family hydrolase
MTKEIQNDQMPKELPARSSLYSCFGIHSGFLILISSFLSLLVGSAAPASAQSVTRAEALRIGESYVQHRWQSSVKNVRHGKDRKGIEVHTPDRDGGHGTPLSECWLVNSENLGVAYKWGGTDTVASFDLGIRAGKAAGDVYTLEKRRLDDAAVSDAAVGIDCSGFICRCWKNAETLFDQFAG